MNYDTVFKRGDADVKRAIDLTANLRTGTVLNRYPLDLIIANAYLQGMFDCAKSAILDDDSKEPK